MQPAAATTETGMRNCRQDRTDFIFLGWHACRVQFFRLDSAGTAAAIPSPDADQRRRNHDEHCDDGSMRPPESHEQVRRDHTRRA